MDVGANAYKTPERATIYIPAVTMVAACISADTGVGPAIASGNQVYKGICALLPIAPTNNNKVIAVIITITANRSRLLVRKPL